jgi:hypothetical protein
MGAGQSTEEYVQNNIEFSQTTSTMSKVCSSTNVSTKTSQNVDIIFEVDNLVFDGNINVSQFANVELNTYSLTSAGISAKQVADLQNSVENDIQSLQTKVTEDFGAIAGAAQAGNSAYKDLQTAISQSVSSSISSETVSDLFAQAQVDQASTITFRGKALTFKGNLDVGQDIILSVIAQQMVQSAVDSLMQTQAVADLVNKVKTEQSTENKGLANIVSSIGSALSGIISSSNFLFLILGVVACVGIYLYIKNGGTLPGPGRFASLGRASPLSSRPPAYAQQAAPQASPQAPQPPRYAPAYAQQAPMQAPPQAPPQAPMYAPQPQPPMAYAPAPQAAPAPGMYAPALGAAAPQPFGQQAFAPPQPFGQQALSPQASSFGPPGFEPPSFAPQMPSQYVLPAFP